MRRCILPGSRTAFAERKPRSALGRRGQHRVSAGAGARHRADGAAARRAARRPRPAAATADARSSCAPCNGGCSITFIHVTHNQEEALAIADQIVVMQDGRIQQAGCPQDVYTAPGQPVHERLHGRQQRRARPGQRRSSGGEVWVGGDGVTLLGPARCNRCRGRPGTCYASVRASCVLAEPVAG